MKKKRIVVIGGGTGTFVTLTALKPYGFDLSAIVTMADDGGSTGLLRDELGVLPPGDLRQALVALSDSSQVLRDLFNYRFQGPKNGSLSGHSFGNLFLSALEKVTGSMQNAIDEAHQLLQIQGEVIPVTLKPVHLVAKTKSGNRIEGEYEIGQTIFSEKDPLALVSLLPRVRANPRALAAIQKADAIFIGPGNIYGSLLPNFLVSGISQAIQKSKAKLILNCNLINKYGHTDDFFVENHADFFETYLGRKFDAVIFNTKMPSRPLIRRYLREGELVPIPLEKNFKKERTLFLGFPLISELKKSPQRRKSKGEVSFVRRSFIRHDSRLLGRALHKTLEKLAILEADAQGKRGGKKRSKRS